MHHFQNEIERAEVKGVCFSYLKKQLRAKQRIGRVSGFFWKVELRAEAGSVSRLTNAGGNDGTLNRSRTWRVWQRFLCKREVRSSSAATKKFLIPAEGSNDGLVILLCMPQLS
jgi:hypothetical protein